MRITPPPDTEDECFTAFTAKNPDVKYITFQGMGTGSDCGGKSAAYTGSLSPSSAGYRACAVVSLVPPSLHSLCWLTVARIAYAHVRVLKVFCIIMLVHNSLLIAQRASPMARRRHFGGREAT